MIIVLFHALYLFGRYVYDRFNNRQEKTEDTCAPNKLLNVSQADYDNMPVFRRATNDVKIKFFPPVYVQRYTTVQGVLASSKYHGKIQKVIDFGCAELSFAIHLKNTDGIREIFCVDVDRGLLENFQTKVAPLHCDYLCIRNEPLTIHVCEGSIAHSDKKFDNTDAVVCIELIEHLYPDDLDAFPYNVFGFIKPLVAIVTTPNADFNVLFKELNGFRHADHKFEWTREQFQDWANNIILRYPDYEVTFHGIGAGPEGTEHLGFCSQMAVFHRHTQLYDEKPKGVDGLLKTVVSHVYPYRPDNRSDEEKILEEAVYYIKLYSAREEEFSEEIPLNRLMFSVEKFRISIENLRSILEEANWPIVDREDGPVVLVPPQSMFSMNTDVDYDDFLDNDYRQNGNDDDWDTLEPGAPRSGYFFDSYMDTDPQNHEEEENWDDEPNDTRLSSNSNLNSENLPNSELQVSENLDHTSDSQWTMEDLNNEDPLLDSSQRQQGTLLDVCGTETELPSNSFSIGLDGMDIDHLNVSNDTLDSSEHNLSSPLPLSELSDASQSLEIDSTHSFSTNRNPKVPDTGFQESSQSEEGNTGTFVEISKNLKLDDPFLTSPPQAARENQAQYDCNYSGPANEKSNKEFQICLNLSVRENDTKNYARRTDVHVSSNDRSRLLSEDSPSLYLESAATDEIGCCTLRNETSSISTLEATLLLSDTQSLVVEDWDLSLNAQEKLGNEEFLNNGRDGSKQSIESISMDRNTFLTDQPMSENDRHDDLCSIYLQPSCTSDNSLYAENDHFYLSVRDSSAATIESYRNLDVSGDRVNYSYQKYETNSINVQKLESEGIKSQDSISFKSISNCSLDLQPKYTSSPQISTDICEIQTRNEDKRHQLINKPRLHNYKCTSLPRILPQTARSPEVKDTDLCNAYQTNIQKIPGKTLEVGYSVKMNLLYPNDVRKDNATGNQNTLLEKYSLEGKNVDETDAILNWKELKTAVNISPSTSQLSLQSNSDISLSTATSTGSSNVEKWYTAEVNPMYRQDLLVLKGGNDTADNPNEETTSDSDATVSSSEKGKDREASKIIDRRLKTSDRCNKIMKNNQPQENLNKKMVENVDDLLKPPYLETVKFYSDNLSKGEMNEKLPCTFFEQKNYGKNGKNSHNLSIDKSSENIIAEESISVQNEPGMLWQNKSLTLQSPGEKMTPSLSTENVSSLDLPNSIGLENTVKNLDVTVTRGTKKMLENFFHKTNDSLTFSKPSPANGSVNENESSSEIYEVTKTLTGSNKKIFEKVDETRYKLESTLETTKKMADFKPLVSGEMESIVAGKNVDNAVNIHEIIPEQVQSITAQKIDDQEYQLLLDFPDQSSDLMLSGFSKKNFSTLDIFTTRTSERSELQSAMPNCKSTLSNEVSTSHNVSKNTKGGSQLRYEFDSTRGLEILESKPLSPESIDTPPNSWSPEVMDSGYPNSASVHDITPEYELSSIANDRISDSDSASVGEVPVPGFYEFVEVENGDLANNNRDDEGNNVIAYEANDIDDLQPLIDVLENDMENENDIYVLQNGFPLWLLRILEMANPIDLEGMGAQQMYPIPLEQAGGDAPNVNADNDEGFDSSSSEDDTDIEDDEADDATTISSDETEDLSAENLRRDWRAGGDP